MCKIFISYRRADSRVTSKRLTNIIANRLTDCEVVIDFAETLPRGPKFEALLAQEVEKADVMVVVIGPDWLNIRDERGNRRLGNPKDFIRTEVEAGLINESAEVIIALIEGANLPNEDDLPEHLKKLAQSYVVTIREGKHFDVDIEHLVSAIQKAQLLME